MYELFLFQGDWHLKIEDLNNGDGIKINYFGAEIKNLIECKDIPKIVSYNYVYDFYLLCYNIGITPLNIVHSEIASNNCLKLDYEVNKVLGAMTYYGININGKTYNPLYSQSINGRIYTSNPNIQNIKKDNRNMLCEDGYCIIIGDYVAQELMIAKYCSDINFKMNDNDDIISHYMNILKLDRVVTKRVIYSLINGASLKYIITAFGIEYKTVYYIQNVLINDINLFLDKIVNNTITDGILHTLPPINRAIHIDGLENKNELELCLKGIKSDKNTFDIIKKIRNYFISGTASDIIKYAMIQINKFANNNKEYDIKIRLVLFDEIITTCKEEYKDKWSINMKNIMQDASGKWFNGRFIKIKIRYKW